MKTLTIIFLLLSFSVTGQPIKYKRVYLDKYKVDFNLGIISYYGNYSVYDTNLINKLTQESGLSFSTKFGRQITPFLELSAQVLIGQLKGAKKHYNSNIIEYNIQTDINFVELFTDNNGDKKLGLLIFGGVGKVYFNNTIAEFDTIYKSKVSEFVKIFGGSVSYELNKNSDIKATATLSQYSKNNYFTVLSIGYVYKIVNIKLKKKKKRNNFAHF